MVLLSAPKFSLTPSKNGKETGLEKEGSVQQFSDGSPIHHYITALPLVTEGEYCHRDGHIFCHYLVLSNKNPAHEMICGRRQRVIVYQATTNA